jgi:hypothetical protein
VCQAFITKQPSVSGYESNGFGQVDFQRCTRQVGRMVAKNGQHTIVHKCDKTERMTIDLVSSKNDKSNGATYIRSV